MTDTDADLGLAEIEAEAYLAGADHYKRVYAEDGVPCPVKGCRISAQEHHRLAYGWITELRELRAYKRDTEEKTG